MTSQILNFFFLSHLLLTFLGLSVFVIRKLVSGRRLPLSSTSELRLHHLLILMAFSLPLSVVVDFEEFKYRPVAKIQTGSTYKEFDQRWSSKDNGARLELSSKIPPVSSEVVYQGIIIFLSGSLLAGLGFFIKDLLSVRRLLKDSMPIRHVGRVRIAISDRAHGPFSVWQGSAWVVIPTSMIADTQMYRLSVRHELQHHRQRDTLWVYPIYLMKFIFGINPVARVWSRVFGEVQELACDENLIDQGKIDSREYARGLIEIAETAIFQKSKLASATSLSFLGDRHTLLRRIESMLQPKKRSKPGALILGLALAFLAGSTALAARNLVVDHRISMSDAQEMARTARQGSDFPIVVNEEVLKELNRYLGTEQGRSFIKDSVVRMEQYRPMIESKMRQYQVPSEIMAVGLVESGYKNLPQSQNKAWGAGVWMFIVSTARHYGLRVDETVDERLNVELETDAAMRYLSANHLRFKDWQLSIFAYNFGEQNLQKGLDNLRTRDPWVLIRNGIEGDKGYLAKVMAAVLILKNPGTFQ